MAETNPGKQFPLVLQPRGDLHLARKLWHMVTGLMIVFIYDLTAMSRTTGVLILGSILLFNLTLEFARLRIPKINQATIRFWRPIMRKGEENRLTGVPFYLAAAILVIAIFPKPVAMLSLLYLACGDPAASFFGIRYGYLGPKFANGKSLVGTLAGVLVCSVITALYLSAVPSLPSNSVVFFGLVVLGGVAGGVAEVLPFEMDDNFTVPVVSSLVLWPAFLFLGL